MLNQKTTTTKKSYAKSQKRHLMVVPLVHCEKKKSKIFVALIKPGKSVSKVIYMLQVKFDFRFIILI